jgi:hypothetical protein
MSVSLETPLTSDSTRVLVSWPSPNSRQAQRERPLRVIDRFEEPESPQTPSTLIATSSRDTASGNSGLGAEEFDMDSGSELETEFEDEASLCELSESGWEQESEDTASGTAPQKRKFRTQAEKEEMRIKAEKRKRRKEEQKDEDDGEADQDKNGKSILPKNPPAQEYNYRLPCPYHKYNPDQFNDNACTRTFRSISHLW